MKLSNPFPLECILQVDVSYNIADISDEPAFSIDVRLGKQWRHHRNTSHESAHMASYPLAHGIEEFRVNIEVCTRYRLPVMFNGHGSHYRSQSTRFNSYTKEPTITAGVHYTLPRD